MTPYRVGLVEDDPRLRDSITRGLRQDGFEVPLTVASGAAFLDAVTGEEPGRPAPAPLPGPLPGPRAAVDVAVLDIGLPDCDGRDLCMALRARGLDVPVLFLTARGDVGDRLLGFHAGGDDYLAKPFAFAELTARVTALARRHVRRDPGPPGLVLDPLAHAVRVPGDHERSATLTPTEYRVLSVLLGHRGEVVRRRALAASAWAPGAIVADNTLDAYVARIRRKLREVGADVEVRTVHGVGYRADPPDTP